MDTGPDAGAGARAQGDGGAAGTGGAAAGSGGAADGGGASGGAPESDAGGERPRCKRGVGYGYHSMADLEALGPGVHWWYNWSPEPDSAVGSGYANLGVEFVPMLWNGSFDVNDVIGRIPDDARTLLGFNEPNYFSQANMSVSEAVARWADLESVADARGLAIASPAVNFCGDGCHEESPFDYLDAFFAACDGCRVDYVAAHWYACDGSALTWYLGELKRYGRPIWLTEFSCGDASDRSLEVQKTYMTEAVAILEADPDVYRYAWFAGRTDAIPNVDLLGADGELTELGQLYLSLPHADSRCDRR